MNRLTFLVLLFSIMVQVVHADVWATLQVDEGRFTVAFPAEPVSESLKIDTVFGSATLAVHAVDAGESAFFAGYYDIPEDVQFSDAELLDAERDRGLHGSSASLVRDEPFTAAGYSGRQIVADRAKLRVRTRNFVVGQRLYTLMVIGHVDIDMDATANRFFESFTVWSPGERSK